MLNISTGSVLWELGGGGATSQMAGIIGLGLEERVEFCHAEMQGSLKDKKRKTNDANHREMKKHIKKGEVLSGSCFPCTRT